MTLSQVYSEIEENEQEYFLRSQLRYEYILRHLVDLTMIGPTPFLLDVGSHWMHLTMAASLSGFNCYGFDLSFYTCEDMLLKRAVKYGIKLGCVDLAEHQIPLSSQSFDIILFSEVLEHLPYSPIPILAEFRRILKPGGVLLLTTPNVFSSGNRLRMLTGLGNIYTELDHFLAGPSFSIHWREYTMSEVKRLIEQSGFDSTVGKYFDANLNTKGAISGFVKRRIYPTISVLFPAISNCMFFLARKPVN